mgnify:CR=1 FL=1
MLWLPLGHGQPGCFLCTTSSTLRELPVAGVNLLSAQDARIEIGGGGADPGERKLWTRCAAAIMTV